jgi:hypothetical protein
VVFNKGWSVGCSIRDFSQGGEKLVIRDATLLPHDSQLQMLDGRLLDCELRWAWNGAIGVEFIF